MLHSYRDEKNNGTIRMISHEREFEYFFRERKAGQFYHTIAWNKGPDQQIFIDGVTYDFHSNTVLPLMLNQSFSFEKPETIIAWQFNREFYCIVDHDKDVGCVGFLFFGPSPTMFIHLDDDHLHKLDRLESLFDEEFRADEEIKGEMLRTLLVRLIITLTRLGKIQYGANAYGGENFDLLRQFNLLVEEHFRKEKQVKFYAARLNRSPKTISNLFSLYSKKGPLEIIHERVVTEAKRLMNYTDKSVKEIAAELGFQDTAHFSKFFKNATSLNPSDFKQPGAGRKGKNLP